MRGSSCHSMDSWLPSVMGSCVFSALPNRLFPLVHKGLAISGPCVIVFKGANFLSKGFVTFSKESPINHHARQEGQPSPAGDDMDDGDSLAKELFANPDVEPVAAAAPYLPEPPNAELTSPGPVPTTPAVTPPEDVVPQLEFNSSNFGKQWKLLDRVARGPRAKNFPTIADLWRGDGASKQRALKMYLESSESLQSAESRLHVEKSHAEKITYKKAWLTIAQMKEHGMSEKLVCIFFIVLQVHFGNYPLFTVYFLRCYMYEI